MTQDTLEKPEGMLLPVLTSGVGEAPLDSAVAELQTPVVVCANEEEFEQARHQSVAQGTAFVVGGSRSVAEGSGELRAVAAVDGPFGELDDEDELAFLTGEYAQRVLGTEYSDSNLAVMFARYLTFRFNKFGFRGHYERMLFEQWCVGKGKEAGALPDWWNDYGATDDVVSVMDRMIVHSEQALEKLRAARQTYARHHLGADAVKSADEWAERERRLARD